MVIGGGILQNRSSKPRTNSVRARRSSGQSCGRGNDSASCRGWCRAFIVVEAASQEASNSPPGEKSWAALCCHAEKFAQSLGKTAIPAGFEPEYGPNRFAELQSSLAKLRVPLGAVGIAWRHQKAAEMGPEWARGAPATRPGWQPVGSPTRSLLLRVNEGRREPTAPSLKVRPTG